VVERLPAGTHSLLVASGEVFTDAPEDDPDNSYVVLQGDFDTRDPIRYDLGITPAVHTDVDPDPFEAAGNDRCEGSAPFLELTDEAFTDSVVAVSFDTHLDEDWYSVVSTAAGLLFAEIRGPSGDLIEATLSRVTSGPTVLLTRDGAVTLDAPLIAGGVTNGPLTEGARALQHVGTCACWVDGAVVQPGEHLLHVVNQDANPGTYTMTISWAPGASPAPVRDATSFGTDSGGRTHP
jgi:hypothetical protein